MAGIYHERIYVSHILYVMCLEEAASGRSLDSKLKYININEYVFFTSKGRKKKSKPKSRFMS